MLSQQLYPSPHSYLDLTVSVDLLGPIVECFNPMTDSSDGVVTPTSTTTTTTSTTANSIMLGPECGPSDQSTSASHDDPTSDSQLLPVSSRCPCPHHQCDIGPGDQGPGKAGCCGSSECILCRLVDLTLQQQQQQHQPEDNPEDPGTSLSLNSLLLSPTPKTDPSSRNSNEEIAILYSSPSLSPISAGSTSPFSSLCSLHPASPSSSSSASPLGPVDQCDSTATTTAITTHPKSCCLLDGCSSMVSSSSNTTTTTNTGPSVASPPSVVISDHSLAENELDHHESQFSKSALGCRLRYLQQDQLHQKSQQQQEQQPELPHQLLRRDSVASICSSTSSLSSLGEDDCIVLESAITQSPTLVSTTSNTSSVSCLVQSSFGTGSAQQSSCSSGSKSTCLGSTPHRTRIQTSAWRKVRSLVTSPFMQTYKRQRYPWIQLAGHQGNFQSGKQPGTILKKSSGNERRCFELLMRNDSLMDFVPSYLGEVVINQQAYLQLQDLLADFVNPSIMDVKMGIRTYLEDELIKAGERPKLRKDMYDKMVAIDPREPSDQENGQRAITKPRYMVWRETISSTSTLAYRIDGIKLTESSFSATLDSGGSQTTTQTNESNDMSTGSSTTTTTITTTTTTKDFKRIKSESDVRCAILQFTANRAHCIAKYQQKLSTIRNALESSSFFRDHELIGSSLLFVHDETRADIWLIDFAKTYPLPADCPRISHQSEWTLGNHEDGYLTGFDNLATLFATL